MNPWIINIPWYYKITRILHCCFSMMAHVVFLDYIRQDLEAMSVDCQKYEEKKT